MTPAEVLSSDLAQAAQQLRDQDQPFAFATIVRTAGATAAKPGAKALLSEDGTILRGWLGGGCTKGAVKKAALEALSSGSPQLVSIAPEDLLEEKGVRAGEEVEGTKFARNGCPSRGSVDVFIEPCLPAPKLMIYGHSPVAEALSALAPQFHWLVEAAPEQLSENNPGPAKAIVVATQGNGDLAALKAALAQNSEHVAFVGSQRKYMNLAQKLIDAGVPADAVNSVRAPAGLDLGAVTPEEIALSILAELVSLRRLAVKSG